MPKHDAYVVANDNQDLSDLGVHVKVWRGWRVAHRLREPENENVESVVRRITAKMKRSTDRPFTTESTQRTKSVLQRQEASDAAKSKVQARAAAQKANALLVL